VWWPIAGKKSGVACNVSVAAISLLRATLQHRGIFSEAVPVDFSVEGQAVYSNPCVNLHKTLSK
jgi:hypothetical protein